MRATPAPGWPTRLFGPLLLSFGIAAHDDAAAPTGVELGCGLFPVGLADPAKTVLCLEITRGSHAEFQCRGVEPDFVVAFNGPAGRFLSARPADELEMEFGRESARIRAAVTALAELGVHQEVCAIATRVCGADNAGLLPQLPLVGDGFIPLIGYQDQGFPLVPVY